MPTLVLPSPSVLFVESTYGSSRHEFLGLPPCRAARVSPSLYPMTPWSSSFGYHAAVISTPQYSLSPYRARSCCASRGPGLPLCCRRVLRNMSSPYTHSVYFSLRRENGHAHFRALLPKSSGLMDVIRTTRLTVPQFRFRNSSFLFFVTVRRNLPSRPFAFVVIFAVPLSK